MCLCRAIKASEVEAEILALRLCVVKLLCRAVERPSRPTGVVRRKALGIFTELRDE